MKSYIMRTDYTDNGPVESLHREFDGPQESLDREVATLNAMKICKPMRPDLRYKTGQLLHPPTTFVAVPVV
jgi:hypothetical protein